MYTLCFIYVYIYIVFVFVCVCVCVYIYIYIVKQARIFLSSLPARVKKIAKPPARLLPVGQRTRSLARPPSAGRGYLHTWLHS